MDEVLQFLKSAGTFYLATVEGAQPRVRPFGAILSFEGKLYLITGNKKDVFKQVQANPKVELSGTDAAGNWLRVAATLVPDARREPKEAMLEAFPNLKRMYAVDDGIMEVLYLKDATATFSSFTSAPRTVTF